MVKRSFAPHILAHVYIAWSLALLAARQNVVGHDVMGGLCPGHELAGPRGRNINLFHLNCDFFISIAQITF